MSLKIPKPANIEAFTVEEEKDIILHVGMERPSLQKFLLAPFHDKQPRFASVLITIVMVFLGAMITGWTLVGARYAASVAVGEGLYIKTFIIALVSASVFLITSLWTYDPDLPNVVLPEIAMGMVGTSKFGVVTALAYTVVSWGGFLAAGGILKALGAVSTRTAPLINYATGTNSYWLYWFGGTVVVFSYIFNFHFKQQGTNRGERMTHAHWRGSLATALAIFLFTLGAGTGTAPTAPFAGLNGLYTFSSGQYWTGYIINTDAAQSYDTVLAGGTVGTYNVFGVNPPAFFILVGWLANPATVVAIIILLGLLNSLGNYWTGAVEKRMTYSSVPEESESAPMAPTAAKVSRRLVGRDVQVNYSY
jgi:hypothetical protein